MQEFMNSLKKIDVLYYATGFTVIVSFLVVVYAVIFIPIPESNKEGFAHLRGMVEGAFVGGLVGYFFVQSKKQPDDNNLVK